MFSFQNEFNGEIKMNKEEIEKKRNEAKSWIENANFSFRMRLSRYYDDYEDDHPVMQKKFDYELECYSKAITCLTFIPKEDRTKEDYSLIIKYCHGAKIAAGKSTMPSMANHMEELAKFYTIEAAEKEKVLTNPSTAKLSEASLSSNKILLFNNATNKNQSSSEENLNEKKGISFCHR